MLRRHGLCQSKGRVAAWRWRHTLASRSRCLCQHTAVVSQRGTKQPQSLSWSRCADFPWWVAEAWRGDQCRGLSDKRFAGEERRLFPSERLRGPASCILAVPRDPVPSLSWLALCLLFLRL